MTPARAAKIRRQYNANLLKMFLEDEVFRNRVIRSKTEFEPFLKNFEGDENSTKCVMKYRTEYLAEEKKARRLRREAARHEKNLQKKAQNGGLQCTTG